MHGRIGPRRSTAGFSLVELLLALALGLVVVTGIVQLFVGNSQTYRLLNGQARMQESGRFALEFIARAARSAGYLGCSVGPDNLAWGLRGDRSLMPEFNIDLAVQGFEGVGDDWNPPLTGLPRNGVNVYDPDGAGVGIDTAGIAPGTDVLVVRSVQRPGHPLVQTLQPDGNPVVSAPGGVLGFTEDDMVMVSNCEQGAVFRVTDIAVAGDEAVLSHATASTGNPYENADMISSPAGLVPFTLSVLGRSYGPEAFVGRVETTVFYVAEGAGLDNRGNPVLSLWQKVGRAPPVELIEGVEDLQVLYGLDTTLTDGIANANRYVPYNGLPDPDDPSAVVSLRVRVTVNSVDAVTEDDQALQRTFSKTILLRNAAPEAV